MLIQRIKSQYDNVMVQFDIPFVEVYEKIVKTPIIVEDKDKIPQWKFASVNSNKRCTEAMNTTSVLMLDYDDKGMTIEKFKKAFEDYEYILHTSYSYDKEHEKFRVLLKLDKEYEINRLFFKNTDKQFSPYHILLEAFDKIDPASFVKAQFFKIPAIKVKNADYKSEYHSGKPFNLFEDIHTMSNYEIAYTTCETVYNNYLRELAKRAEQIKKARGNDDLSAAKKYVEKSIEGAAEGERHNKVFSLACWWKRLGGTYPEFAQIMPTWADSSFDRQLRRLNREWYKLSTR